MPGTNSTFQIDAILRTIARPQLGLVTVVQADDAGVDRFALERRRESGALVAVFAGVMRLGSVAPTAEQRILAASLTMPGSVVAARSAGVVHQLPVGHDVGPPIVSVEPHRSARTVGVVTLRPSVELPSQPWHTARVATPAATLLLLPRFVDAAVVERCLDHCLAHRLTTVVAVRDLIERVPFRAVRGRRLLLDLLDQRSAGIGHRSRLEQQVARWLAHAGLRGWQRNFSAPVRGGSVEVDFAWPSEKVALEVSPFFTHGSRAQQDRDAKRRRLLVEREWRIVEATDPDLESRLAFAATIASLRRLIGDTSEGFVCAV